MLKKTHILTIINIIIAGIFIIDTVGYPLSNQSSLRVPVDLDDTTDRIIKIEKNMLKNQDKNPVYVTYCHSYVQSLILEQLKKGEKIDIGPTNKELKKAGLFDLMVKVRKRMEELKMFGHCVNIGGIHAGRYSLLSIFIEGKIKPVLPEERGWVGIEGQRLFSQDIPSLFGPYMIVTGYTTNENAFIGRYVKDKGCLFGITGSRPIIYEQECAWYVVPSEKDKEFFISNLKKAVEKIKYSRRDLYRVSKKIITYEEFLNKSKDNLLKPINPDLITEISKPPHSNRRLFNFLGWNNFVHKILPQSI